MTSSSHAKRVIAIVGAFVLALVGLASLGTVVNDVAEMPASGESHLVGTSGHILGEEGASGVTFVGFLDFECPACRGYHPTVQQLREDYAGKVTFVARHFPMPHHFNGERAARAAEAAGQQGRYEDMFNRLFETQPEWAGQHVPHGDLFASYAKDLGLDMDQYRDDFHSSAVVQVARDVTDGQRHGVDGTPTFFIDGDVVRVRTYEDLANALDAALARR